MQHMYVLEHTKNGKSKDRLVTGRERITLGQEQGRFLERMSFRLGVLDRLGATEGLRSRKICASISRSNDTVDLRPMGRKS